MSYAGIAEMRVLKPLSGKGFCAIIGKEVGCDRNITRRELIQRLGEESGRAS